MQPTDELNLNGWTPVRFDLPAALPINGDPERHGSWPSRPVLVLTQSGLTLTATYDTKWSEWRDPIVENRFISDPVMFWREAIALPGQMLEVLPTTIPSDSFSIVLALKHAETLVDLFVKAGAGHPYLRTIRAIQVSAQRAVVGLQQGKDKVILLLQKAQNLVADHERQIDFLKEETHNWSNAVRQMTAERNAAPSRAKVEQMIAKYGRDLAFYRQQREYAEVVSQNSGEGTIIYYDVNEAYRADEVAAYYLNLSAETVADINLLRYVIGLDHNGVPLVEDDNNWDDDSGNIPGQLTPFVPVAQ